MQTRLATTSPRRGRISDQRVAPLSQGARVERDHLPGEGAGGVRKALSGSVHHAGTHQQKTQGHDRGPEVADVEIDETAPARVDCTM